MIFSHVLYQLSYLGASGPRLAAERRHLLNHNPPAQASFGTSAPPCHGAAAQGSGIGVRDGRAVESRVGDGAGAGVAVGVDGGAGDAVCPAVALGEVVGRAVGVGVGVAGGVEVGVRVSVARAVGVGVGVGIGDWLVAGGAMVGLGEPVGRGPVPAITTPSTTSATTAAAKNSPTARSGGSSPLLFIWATIDPRCESFGRQPSPARAARPWYGRRAARHRSACAAGSRARGSSGGSRRSQMTWPRAS